MSLGITHSQVQLWKTSMIFIQTLKAESGPHHLFPGSTLLLSSLMGDVLQIQVEQLKRGFNHTRSTLSLEGHKQWASSDESHRSAVRVPRLHPGLTQHTSLLERQKNKEPCFKGRENAHGDKGGLTLSPFLKMTRPAWNTGHSRINTSSQNGIPCAVHCNLGSSLSHWQGWNWQH